MMNPDDIVIIGAGPAGVTAAIQLKRYGIPFILLEKERVGGLLWNANLVENYPGFPAGVRGPKLVGLIEKQMKRIGVDVTFGAVSSLKKAGSNFHMETTQGIYHPRYAIVASGTKPNPIPLTVPDLAKNKVFSDVYHLLNEANKRILIVGAGDAAFDYALNLVKKRNFVTILNRGVEVKCLGLLWERAKAETAIEYYAETPVVELEVDDNGDRLRVWTEAGKSIETDYLLFAIGRFPQTDFLSAELINQNAPGLYFVGDVQNGLYRQAAIAAGDGLRAAMDIYFRMNSEAKLS